MTIVTVVDRVWLEKKEVGPEGEDSYHSSIKVKESECHQRRRKRKLGVFIRFLTGNEDTVNVADRKK